MLALSRVKEEIKAGNFQEAFARLNSLSGKDDDFLAQMKYASLYELMAGKLPQLKEIRIAILPSSTVTHFAQILKYWLAQEGFSADIFESEYNTIAQTILDPQSPLYQFNPDITLIFTNYRDVRFAPLNDTTPEDINKAVASAVNDFKILWKALRQNSTCAIIQNNADLPFPRVLGNYEGTASWGQMNMLRQFNMELAQAACEGVAIFDLDYASSVYGKRKWVEARYWYHSKNAFAMDASGPLAYEFAKLIAAAKGSAKKCLVLDLDNTLWGGEIGDDGVENIRLGNGPDGEAFVDFQKYLLQLKQRGIILTVCSKNNEAAAKEPFLSHPDMQIKLEDIASFKANWQNKADNIKAIAQELNIGLDSLVFIDDNPAERELVRGFLPMVTVPELPKDPTCYIQDLSSRSYFEIVSFSKEDAKRAEFYRGNAVRMDFQKQFTDLTEYLKNLDMEMKVEGITDFNLSRAAQLINKSNQFHLTTTRYNEHEIKTFQQDEGKFLKCFSLTDRFGNNGLISVVILDKQKEAGLAIDTWVMSCRVLSRGVEEFIMKEIVQVAKQTGLKYIEGKYLPTPKNQLVKDLYGKLQFKLKKEDPASYLWELPLNGQIPSYETFIKKSES